jgi:hypothetical protein
MKKYSDNIRAAAGILAVNNLNVFPHSGVDGVLDYTVPWQTSFREACRRAAILAAKAMDPEWGEPGMFSLLELSVPRFEVLGDDRYRLTGGLFLWAGHLFSPGATFRVRDNDLNFETPELIQVATAVPAEMLEMQYDTYNATALKEISDEVVAELGMTFDKSTFKSFDEIDENDEDEDDCSEISQVKYLSVYAKTLTGGEPGRVIAYGVCTARPEGYHAVPASGLEFDTSYFDEVVDYKTYFDRFLIEFVNKSQQFAYVAIETLGEPARPDAEDNTYPSVDWFARMFDGTNKDEFATHDKAEIVETLRKIGAGE